MGGGGSAALAPILRAFRDVGSAGLGRGRRRQPLKAKGPSLVSEQVRDVPAVAASLNDLRLPCGGPIRTRFPVHVATSLGEPVPAWLSLILGAGAGTLRALRTDP